MRTGVIWLEAVLTATVTFLAASFPFLGTPPLTAAAFFLYVCINLVPSVRNRRLAGRRLRVCADGCSLLRSFVLSAAASTVFLLALLFGGLFYVSRGRFLAALISTVLLEGIVFWNGILRVYCTSVQLGIKWRVLGAVCGWIPFLNLFMLSKIIRLASAEAEFESGKLRLNESRREEQICRTKYPLLLVHGVFFRDYRYINYWGRIPGELEKNGAEIFYGNHQSAAAVADSAAEIAARIREILRETGSGKVNIIAHSKGGLDCRYAVSMLGMAPYVASLTTINTPHRGCVFADYLLSVIPESVQGTIAAAYNAALKKLGDESPDFMAAVGDLTASACLAMNEIVKDSPGVYYQSVGSKLNKAADGQFPLNFSYKLVKYFDGPNDGLVADESFPWGSRYQMLVTAGERGISHGDMVDLNRENLMDFDVREFYVQLVSRLRRMGF